MPSLQDRIDISGNVHGRFDDIIKGISSRPDADRAFQVEWADGSESQWLTADGLREAARRRANGDSGFAGFGAVIVVGVVAYAALTEVL